MLAHPTGRSRPVGSSRQSCESSGVQVPIPSIACIRMVSNIRCMRRQQSMFGSDKSLGRPARVLAAVGTIWEASKLGGLNVKEYLQPRNDHAKKSFWRRKREADPSNWRGRPMTRRKKQAKALRETAGVGDQASEERFIAITSVSRSAFAC